MHVEENPSDVMQIIMSSSAARGQALSAIKMAQAGDADGADRAITAAKTAMREAQAAHNRLLSSEAREEGPQFSLLLIHAEDHLAGAQTMIEVAEAFMVTSAELVALKKEIKD